jgi:inner membrane protein
MASIITHAVGALSLSVCFPKGTLSRNTIVAGILFSMLPDADVVGFYSGIPYDSPLGHRGFSHSLLFAALITGIAGYWFRKEHSFRNNTIFLFLCTVSHGVMDAMTSGGLGVGFFIPFDMTRYFFTYRPVLVSPIGVSEFLGPVGIAVIKSEIKYIWIPCIFFMGAAYFTLYKRSKVSQT